MTPLCGAVVVNKEGHLAATVEQIAAIIDASFVLRLHDHHNDKYNMSTMLIYFFASPAVCSRLL